MVNNKPQVGEACNMALQRGIHYDCRFMPKDSMRNPSGDVECPGAYCAGCPGFPGTNRPVYPTC